MRNLILAALGLPFLLWSAPALAAGDSSEVVVTATRLPTPLSLASDAEVITAEDIRLRQSTFAFDALSTLPGVQISRTGAYGGVTSVKIRGASSDKTLVLVDGAPVNDPTSPAGGFDFSSLDLVGVDRIEVLEGPQGALWGSDAIGGVIAITTREPDGLRAAGEVGAHGTQRVSAAAGLAGAGGAIGAAVGWLDTGGISKADVRDGNPERDPFHSVTAQVNGRLSPSAWLSLDGKVRYNRAFAALDSFGGPTGVIDGPDSQTSRTWSGFVRAHAVGPWGIVQELRADGMDLDRLSNAYFGGSLFPFEARGRRIDLRWTAERTGLGPNDLMAGIEREGAREDTGSGVETSRNWAGFAIWRFTPSDRFSATASVRRDEPRGLAGVTTARGSASLGLGGGVSLAGSYGQGFKAPSIFERTYPCFECLPPGPATSLRPEHARGWDATLAWRPDGGRYSAKATVYGLTVRDQIDYIYPQGYLNILKTRTTGVEAEARSQLFAGLSARASYAYADARDATTGAPLLRVPAHSGAFELDWTGRRAEAAFTLRAQSRAADVYGPIRAFATADLAGSYEVRPGVRLTARLENLFNARYQEAFGYGEPGFGAFVGIRLGEQSPLPQTPIVGSKRQRRDQAAAQRLASWAASSSSAILAQSNSGGGAAAAAITACSSAAVVTPTTTAEASGRDRAKARAACSGSLRPSAIIRRTLERPRAAACKCAGARSGGRNRKPCRKIERRCTSIPISAISARAPFTIRRWSRRLAGACRISGRKRRATPTGSSEA